MKKKKRMKRLSLNKKTIACLEVDHLGDLRGGIEMDTWIPKCKQSEGYTLCDQDTCDITCANCMTFPLSCACSVGC